MNAKNKTRDDVDTKTSLTAADTAQGGVRLSTKRYDICMESLLELEALARLLPECVTRADEESSESYYKVKGIAGRLLRLSSALQNCLDDESEGALRSASNIVHLNYQG